MQLARPINPRCSTCGFSLPVRGGARFGGASNAYRLTADREHPAAVFICSAVSKKSSPGGDLPAEPAAGLATSLLRDAMAALSTSTSSASTLRAGGAGAPPEDLRSASYAIVATNSALFFTCALVPLLPAASLLLHHKQPHVWQLLTSAFAHPSLESLMQCVFFTYVFGRVVERNHGSLATWAVYLVCGVASAALAWWMLPSAKSALLSSAAPAAAWGLFLVGIGFPRLAKKPLEVACLAPFALAATISRYSPLAGLLVQDGVAVGQLVHLVAASLAAGLAAAVLAVVEGWRDEQERKQLEAKRQAEAASQEEALGRVISAAQQLGKKLL